MGDGFCEDVHTHNFNTVVSCTDEANSHLHCHHANMNKISERLKAARLKKGWNQMQLALAADLSPGTIGNIESGARQGRGSLPQIAKALGVSHDWLANGVGDMGMKSEVPDDNRAPIGPSTQAALLALLFDKLENDVVLRAQVFNRASQIIINTIQGIDEPQTQTPATQTTAKKQSA